MDVSGGSSGGLGAAAGSGVPGSRGIPLLQRAAVAWAVAATATAVAIVAVAVVVVRPVPASPVAPQAVATAPVVPVANVSSLYGRWVRSGLACDTKRGDMVISAGNITHHEFGALRSNMKLAGATVASPGVLNVKYTSQDGTFVAFARFELKDADTLMLSDYLFQPDGIWRKC